MISVVIPTLNAEATLAETMGALVPAVIDGLVKEVIIVDGGSSDETAKMVDIAGATFLRSAKGRGIQLATGAQAAKFPWLLFLHADTVLTPGWEREAATFMERIDSGRRPPGAAAFRFALDDNGAKPRILESIVAIRCALFGLPYGDQGLLVPATLYREVGGYQAIPLMEDVDLVRRLGWRRLTMLRAEAVTSAERYRRSGYIVRAIRNLACLALYFVRVPPRLIARLYGTA